MPTLTDISKLLEKVIANQSIDDWQNEDDGLVGFSKRQLQAMRTQPEHATGWRYLGAGVTNDGKTIRRNIQWSKTYLNSLYKQVA